LKSKKVKFSQNNHFITCSFIAMNCPCEIVMELSDLTIAECLAKQAVEEVWRIEKKFSRYRKDNIIALLNSGKSNQITLDDETTKLINYADIAWQQSEGLFDISSGLYRTIWDFKSQNIPSSKDIALINKNVGWHKISWNAPLITIPSAMQIDLGGLGKEYAADMAANVFYESNIPSLINLGGDIVVTQSPTTQTHWKIGLDNPDDTGNSCINEISLARGKGAIATSGDARNFIMFEGKRYGHIINPKTGYPVENAPKSVTICADTCIEAGLYSTLAILHGKGAKVFLDELEMPYWLIN
jgi:thiamine biosynthesis lipoprotein